MPEFDITGKIIKSEIGYSKLKLSNFAIEPEITPYLKGVTIKIKTTGMYLDWDLGIHSNPNCAGVWENDNEAREFLIKTFLN